VNRRFHQAVFLCPYKKESSPFECAADNGRMGETEVKADGFSMKDPPAFFVALT
jgi:hypothetical protein